MCRQRFPPNLTYPMNTVLSCHDLNEDMKTSSRGASSPRWTAAHQRHQYGCRLIISLLIVCFSDAVVSTPTIGAVTTLGSPTQPETAGQDGVASSASFSLPGGVTFSPDASFALLVDKGTYRLRRIDIKSELVTTLTRNSAAGYIDGSCSNASFQFGQYPGIAIDASGSVVLLTDRPNALVRRIDLNTCNVTTFAGRFRQLAAVDGYGTASAFAGPTGIAFDGRSSFALITDTNVLTTSLIRYMNVSTGLVTTLAGTVGRTGYVDGVGPAARMDQPLGITVDWTGSFGLFVDYRNNAVRKVVVQSGIVSTLAGSRIGASGYAEGYGTEALFGSPQSVAMDWAGTVAIVADTYNQLIRRINISSALVTTLAGAYNIATFADGVGTRAYFNFPNGVALDGSGALGLVADGSNQGIRLITLLVSPSPTASPSATLTPSISLVLPSLSPSPSPSSSPSQSCSPEPFSLTLLTVDTSATAAVLSDSLPPVALRLWLSRCPSAADSARLSRALLSCNTDAPTMSVFVAIQTPVDALTILSGVCDPSIAAPAQLQSIVRVGVRFGLPRPRSLSLSCEFRDANSGASLARASLPCDARPSLWPVFSDILLVGAQGTMRSAQLALSLNVTAALLRAAAASLATESVQCSNATGTCADTAFPPSVAWALANPTAVLAAAIDAWSNASFPSAPGPRPFTLTLSGASRVVLRGVAGQRALSPGSNATLGGVPCNISAVSDDGAWAVLDTPSPLALCGRLTRDCNYVPLRVSTAPLAPALGVALSCPPFCPGSLGGGIVPIATGGGGFALGMDPPMNGTPGALPTLLPAPPASTSQGIYYAVACEQTGVWTDPASGACTDPFSPASYGCAYGGGAGCVACPVGALCPGGSRMWPRVGYWAPSDAASSVTPCAPPDASAKCQGWDLGAGAVRCGPPYRDGSYLCGACAGGFYPWGDGTCVSCPPVASVWDRYGALVEAVLGAVAAACVVGLALLWLVRTAGGTLWGSSRRLLDLVQWSVVALQTVSQAAPASSASLPPFLGALFRGLAVLRVEGVLLASSCTGAYAFQSDVGVMGAALALAVTAAAAGVAAGATQSRGSNGLAHLRTLGAAALKALLLLVPAAAKDALALLNCAPASLSPAAAASLDGGPPLQEGASDAGSTITLPLLASNPLYVCWAPGGSQSPAGTLAGFVLAVVVLGMPLVTLAAAWTHARRRARAKPLRAAARGDVAAIADQGGEPPHPPLLAPFLSDYRPEAWYTRHADLALTLLLAALQAFLPHPASPGAIAGKALAVCSGALTLAAHALLVRPFTPQQAWKGPVRATLLCLTAACAVINAWAAAVDAGAASASVAALSACAALVIVLFCAALLLLVSGIVRATLRGIREEQAAIEARLAAARAAQSVVARRRGGRRGLQAGGELADANDPCDHPGDAVDNGGGTVAEEGSSEGGVTVQGEEEGAFNHRNPAALAIAGATLPMPPRQPVSLSTEDASAKSGEQESEDDAGGPRAVSRRLRGSQADAAAAKALSRSRTGWAGLAGVGDSGVAVGFRAMQSRAGRQR